MSTRYTSSNLFSPLRDLESLIRRRNLGEPSSLFDFEEFMSIPHNNQGPPSAGPPPPQNNNGPSLVVRPNGPAPRSMEELCQPSINRRGGPIALIPIQATDFGLRHHMIQQQNEVYDDALRLSLLPYSLTHHVTAWYDRLPRNSIHTFDNMMRKFLLKYFPPSMDTSTTRDEKSRTNSSTTTTKSPEVIRQLEMLNKNFQEMMKQMQSVKSVDMKCETCGGPYSYTECPAPDVAPKPKPSIPYPSRLNDQKLREKTNSQMLKFLQIFQRLHFDLSFADALLRIPKFASTFKSLLSIKRYYLNCLTFTRMTLELAIRSYAYPASIAKDLFVQVGKFTFPADFVVVDYDVYPLVPFILGRPFLRTARAPVDVHEEDLILKHGDEQLIFHADSTSKHPHNTTPLFDSSPSLTPFETSDSLLEEFADELLLYGDYYKDIDYEKEKNKDSKMKSLVVEAHIVESNNLLPQLLDNDLTHPEESAKSSEIISLSTCPFRNKDKEFQKKNHLKFVFVWTREMV
nr:hypothetical protein [Tanacetum cinerariifolium]